MKNKTLAVMLLGSSFLITNALAVTGVGEDKKIVNEIVKNKVEETKIEEKDPQKEIKKEEAISENLLEKTKKAFSDLENQKIKEQLDKMGVSKDIYQIKPTKIDGLKEIAIGQNRMYMDEKVSTVIIGEMYQVNGNGDLINVRQQELFSKIKDFKDSMILYKAPEEKYVVTAFIDSTCHYCIKLHQEMKEYNDKGITFQFLAYPREGLESRTARLMEAAFTSENPSESLSLLEKRKFNAEKPVDVVKKHYEFGQDYGLTGTPMLILPNGEIVAGYLKSDQLLKALKEMK